MNGQMYQVVLSGELAAGKSPTEVAKNLAALFKTTPEKAGMLLKKPGAAVKKNVDLETAKKYVRAISATGAVCRLDPPEPAAKPAPKPAHKPNPKPAPQPAAAPSAAVGKTEPRVVVIPLASKGEDRFAPQNLTKLLGSADGVELLYGENQNEALYDHILAIAAFNQNSGGALVTKFLMFIRSMDRPVICDIDHIVFDGFPIKVFPKNIASFRGLLHHICTQNPSVILEETTLDFLSGSPPQSLDEQKTLKLATGIGLLIESGDADSQT